MKLLFLIKVAIIGEAIFKHYGCVPDWSRVIYLPVVSLCKGFSVFAINRSPQVFQLEALLITMSEFKNDI